MAQFDIFSFSTQIFWFLIFLVIFYFFTLTILSKCAEVIKIREKLFYNNNNKLVNKSKKNLYDLYLKEFFKSF
jgi:hypothetical protein